MNFINLFEIVVCILIIYYLLIFILNKFEKNIHLPKISLLNISAKTLDYKKSIRLSLSFYLVLILILLSPILIPIIISPTLGHNLFNIDLNKILATVVGVIVGIASIFFASNGKKIWQ